MNDTLRLCFRAMAGTAVLLLLMPSVFSGADDPPNIILCMGDDHGWDETGYNGHPHLQTPVLDEIAASGLRLDRFYSAHPSCSPTRGSVMTGRHPNRYGTFAPNYSIRPEEISIAWILQKAGYSCGHFGKWHLGPVKAASPTSPGAMGFHQWLSHDNFFELNPTFSRNGASPEQFKGESSEIVIRETIRFLETAQQNGKPFFAVVWFGSPHEPYSGLKKDLALYTDLPQEYADRQVTLTSNKTGRQTRRPLRDVLQERYAEITAMDRAMGQLRKWLGDNGQRQNTLLWYCGDNGTPRDGIVTSPFRGQKGTMYEGGIRVPGLIEWPERISQPSQSEVNTVTSDMLPTICELLDVPLPERPLDGISLKPLIDGVMTERSAPICFWSFKGGNGAGAEPYIASELQSGTTPLVKMTGDIYTRNFRNFHHSGISKNNFDGDRVLLGNRYKLLVRGLGEDEQTELYDVRSDPGEEHNVFASMPEIGTQLRHQLQDWQQSVLQSLTGADYE